MTGLRRWLFACIVAVFVTVMVGGITRLTESGLSITEWKPVSGVLPPRTEAAWDAAYQEFLRIPQAQTVHRGITMGGFKLIYWWEWFHRLLARGVGLVFAIPYLVLLARRRIPPHLRVRLSALPLLTLAQGALGWHMVQSGLAVRSNVSAYRLTAHLALALCILAVAVWTWAELDPRDDQRDGERPEVARPDTERASRRWRWTLAGTTGLVAVTLLSGGFVAGLRAGRIFNTFPLMGGTFVPPGYAELVPWWANAFENPAAAQFHHRVLAMLTATVALILAWRASRPSHDGLPERTARAVRWFGAVAVLQLTLGIVMLLLAVPVTLGVLHQFTGVFALTLALVATERAWK